jgi:hypothetical protein
MMNFFSLRVNGREVLSSADQYYLIGFEGPIRGLDLRTNTMNSEFSGSIYLQKSTSDFDDVAARVGLTSTRNLRIAAPRGKVSIGSEVIELNGLSDVLFESIDSGSSVNKALLRLSRDGFSELGGRRTAFQADIDAQSVTVNNETVPMSRWSRLSSDERGAVVGGFIAAMTILVGWSFGVAWWLTNH